MADLRIVFMGTPNFAVPSLELLLAQGHKVVAVVTAPDAPRGRGRKIIPSPVKQTAQVYGIPVLQPRKLSEPAFWEVLRNYRADLQVVVAFRILPQVVWSMPPLGTINLHASLLPQYRGAAPINWAIINGERETGVTTFFIDQAVDTGNILFQEKEPIYPYDTAGTLHERLQHKGAQLVLQTVQSIARENHTPTPQKATVESLQKSAPKIYKADGRINWAQNAETILNFIRGLSPYPAAWTTLHGRTYKILSAIQSTAVLPPLAPGDIHSDGKHYLCIGTQSTPVAINTLQPAGAQSMDVKAFLRGNRL
jgi:methionyl-tRNA formyltransferase